MHKELIIQLITLLAPQYGINTQKAVAVAAVESNFNTEARGSLGEIGLFQLRPEHYPNVDLKDPIVNIMTGLEHLKKSEISCKKDLGKAWVVCYNLGIRGGKRLKYPELFVYNRKVERALEKVTKEQNSPGNIFGSRNGDGSWKRVAAYTLPSIRSSSSRSQRLPETCILGVAERRRRRNFERKYRVYCGR